MHYSEYALLLYPADASANIDANRLAGELRNTGLIGGLLEPGKYAVGERFLDHICFLGCSPGIELEPQADKAFCYVALPTRNRETGFAVRGKPDVTRATWIAIGNIHEAEAVPDTEILSRLETLTGCLWKVRHTRLPALSAFPVNEAAAAVSRSDR